MNRNDKIKALEGRLNALTAPKPTSLTDQLINEELENLRADIGNRVSTRGIEKVQADMASFSEKFKLEPVFEAISKADTTNKQAIAALQKNFEKRVQELIQQSKQDSKEERTNFLSRAELLSAVATLRASFEQEIQPLFSRDSLLASEVDGLSQEVRRINLLYTEDEASDAETTQQIQKSIQDLEKKMMSRIAAIGNHGDHANRNIAINGNTSVLSRYTDINFKAGANITFTAVANTTTKYTDVTITGTGGGGGGSGYQAPLSGGLTGTNTWATAPNVLVIDGVSRQQTQTDGTVMWTGTSTTVLTNAPLPNFDIFASA